MTYQVRFAPKAAEELRHLNKTIAQRILTKIRWFSENFDNLAPEALTGHLQGLFKLRVGSYRVTYSVNKTDKVLYIHLVGHRRDIYRMK